MAWTTVRVRAGLGNQLFQYAAGRAVAERTGTRLRLDTCYFGVEPLREFELDRFRIVAKIVSQPAESGHYIGNDAVEDAWVRSRYGAEPLREPHFHFSDVLERAEPDSFITGYWQSPRYFEGIEDQLRSELRPRRLSRRVRQLRSEIAGTHQSVAVHVRRGDVVSESDIQRLIGSAPVDYYPRAAAVIKEQRESPHFFVFSDDPAWCAANLELPGPMRIISGQTDAVEDLALISSCEDAIIANSTYSWWGAWLGEGDGSIVITPARWFDELPHDTSDLRPAHWLAL